MMKHLPVSQYRRLFLAIALTLPFTSQSEGKPTLPLDEIRNFVDVYNVIKNEYVEEKDGEKLLDFAIEGMLNGLDPHSVYLKKEQLENFNESASGSYFGFGFQLDMTDGLLMIVSPIPNSPAEKAGLKPNDRIIKINDTIIRDMSMSDVDQLFKSGNDVKLTISRGYDKNKVVKLSRATITLASVNSKIYDKKYGYIRITQFQNDTAKQFHEALKKQLDSSVKGLIIDLRNNPGGLVVAATEIADEFLDAGLIVSTKNPNTGSEDKVHANKENTLAKETPLVVLINEGSASASELLSGALQSHKRAVIVGQTSFGKGSVQNVIHLANGDAVKLTTARYYTPDNKSIQAEGIIPDIELSQLAVEEKEIDLLSYSESSIPGHLTQKKNKLEKNKSKKTSNDDKKKKNDKNQKANEGKTADSKTDKSADAIISGTALAKSDLQLFEALNVLKALTLRK